MTTTRRYPPPLPREEPAPITVRAPASYPDVEPPTVRVPVAPTATRPPKRHRFPATFAYLNALEAAALMRATARDIEACALRSDGPAMMRARVESRSRVLLRALLGSRAA